MATKNQGCNLQKPTHPTYNSGYSYLIEFDLSHHEDWLFDLCNVSVWVCVCVISARNEGFKSGPSPYYQELIIIIKRVKQEKRDPEEEKKE